MELAAPLNRRIWYNPYSGSLSTSNSDASHENMATMGWFDVTDGIPPLAELRALGYATSLDPRNATWEPHVDVDGATRGAWGVRVKVLEQAGQATVVPTPTAAAPPEISPEIVARRDAGAARRAQIAEAQRQAPRGWEWVNDGTTSQGWRSPSGTLFYGELGARPWDPTVDHGVSIAPPEQLEPAPIAPAAPTALRTPAAIVTMRADDTSPAGQAAASGVSWWWFVAVAAVLVLVLVGKR